MSLLDKYTSIYGSEKVDRLRKRKEELDWKPKTPMSEEKASNIKAAENVLSMTPQEAIKNQYNSNPTYKLATEITGNENVGGGLAMIGALKQRETAQDILKARDYEQKRDSVIEKNGRYAYSTMKRYLTAQKEVEKRLTNNPLTNLTLSKERKGYEDQAKSEKAILNKLGISGKDFDVYAQYVQEYMDIEATEKRQKQIEKTINEHPVLGGIGLTAADIAVSPVSGFSATVEALKKPFYADKDAPINTYSDLYALQNASEAVEQSVANKIDNKIGQFAYSAGVSTLKSAEAMAIAGGLGEVFGIDAASKLGQLATLPIFGTSAFASTVKEAQDRGFSADKAIQKGLASGIAEMLFEELSLDKAWGTFRNAKLGKGGKAQRILDVFMGAGIEGSEEIFTSLANYVADGLINGDFSDYQTEIRMAVEHGMSLEEATKMAKRNFISQLVEDGLAGAFSGGVMNVGTATVGTIKYHNTAKNINANVELKKEVVNAAKELKDTKAAEIANKKPVEEITENEMVDIIHSMEEATQRDAHDIAKETLIKMGESEESAEEKANAIVEMSTQENPTEEQEAKNIELVSDDKNAEAYADVLKSRMAQNTLADVYENNQVVGKKRKGGVDAYVGDKQIKVYDFADVAKGRVNTSVGVMSLSDAKMDENNGRLFRTAYVFEDTPTSNAYIENYKGQNLSDYSTAAMRAFVVGASGAKFETFLNDASNAYAIEAVNDNAFLQEMYFHGQNTAKKENVATVDKTQAEPKKVIGENALNPVFNEVAKAFNLNIETSGETSQSSGSFVPSLLKINLNEKESKNMYQTLHHELMEYSKAYAPEAYERLKSAVMDFATSKLGSPKVKMHLEAYRDTYRGFGRKVGDQAEANKNIADATDEYVNDFVAQVMTTEEGINQFAEYLSEKNMSESEKTSIIQSIKDFIQKIIDTIKSYLTGKNGMNIGSKDAKMLEQYTEDLANIRDYIEQAWEEAREEVSRQLMQSGIEITSNGDTAAHSVRTTLAETWKERGFKSYEEAIRKTAEDITNQMFVKGESSEARNEFLKKAEAWVRAEESIASFILSDEENRRYLDYEADDRYEAIKKNADYPQGTVDFSNLCRKREIFTKMFDALQRENPDVLFTAADIADIREVLVNSNMEVACALCYVEDRRQKMGEIAETFIGMYKDALKSPSKIIFKTNYKGELLALSATKDQVTKHGIEKGHTYRAKDNYVPNQYDLVTYEGYKALEKNHPEIAYAFERYNNSRGMASARLIEGHAEYKREILKYNANKVNSINNHGGLRISSFSDVEGIHIVDLMQVIVDAASKGIKAQAYTKVPEFAKIAKDTRIKINRSLIPANTNSKNAYAYVDGKWISCVGKMKENGIATIKGKEYLAVDIVEGIDVTNEAFLDDHDNPNVGNIIIGISDKQIELAMKDPNIDYIIPFHTNQSHNVLVTKGINIWDNYKDYQTEKWLPGYEKDKAVMVNIYTDVIDRYHPTNIKEFEDAFRKECARKHLEPRFSKWANTEGYYKLLIDFKLFDRSGNILPQQAILPTFDEENLEYIKEFLTKDKERSKAIKFSDEVMSKIKAKMKENGKEVHSVNVQTISSENTSLNQTPATFTNYEFSNTDRVLDWGGGRYDTSKRALEATYPGIRVEVVDPFNRTKSHNDRVLKEYSNNKANVLTINNVLNVINSTSAIEDVIKESKKYLSDDGIAYFAIYEGDGSGIGKETSAGYQNNQKASYYVPFVEKYYKNVDKKGSFILASDGQIHTTKISASTKEKLAENTKEFKKQNLYMKDSAYSLNVDSDGKELSEDQVKFFAKAKTRDEFGRLKSYYHGTAEGGFTVFDVDRSDGALFFSDKESVSESYSGSMLYDLNKRMWDENDTTKEKEEFRRNNGKIEYWTVMNEEGADFGDNMIKYAEFDTIEEAAEWWCDIQGIPYEVFREQVFKQDEKREMFEVYLDVEYPYILDADGAFWNRLIIPEEIKDKTGVSIKVKNYLELSKIYIDTYADIEDLIESLGYLEEGLKQFAEEQKEEGYEIDEKAVQKLAKLGKEIDDIYNNWNPDEHLDDDGEPIKLGRYIRENKVKVKNTRDVVKWAKNHGYDGVIFKNIVDVGWKNINGYEESEVVAVFRPSQVKDTDNLHPTNDVDINYSINVGVDSEGKELTEKQKEFFANSKLRDKDGKLIVMYHGTFNDFTVFDIEKANEDSYRGQGFYFTNSESEAKRTYASLEGGDSQDKLDIRASQILEEWGYTWEGDIEYPTEYTTHKLYGPDSWTRVPADKGKKLYDKAIAKAKEEFKNGKVMKVYLNIENPYIIPKNNTKNIWTISEEVYKGNHDGIIDYSVSKEFNLNRDVFHVTVFKANQIKSVNNESPTENEDIRYSIDVKDIWSGAASAIDGYIEEVHSLAEAESVDYHHSLYFSPEAAERIDNEESVFFWIDDDGEIETEWRYEEAPKWLQEAIKKNIADLQKKGGRFSLDVEDWEADFFAEMTSEQKEVSKIFTEGLKSLDNIEVNKKITDKIAREIKAEYKSRINTKTLSDSLQKIFAYMLDSGSPGYADIVEIMKEVGRPVIEQATEVNQAEKQMYDHLMETLKTYKIRLNESQKAEVANTFGTYYGYKNALFGKAVFSESGSDLDGLWTEIVDASSGLLDYGTNPTDQPMALYEIIEALKPSQTNLYGADQEEAAYDVALSIFRKFLVEQEYENNPKLRAEALKLTEAQQNYKKRLKENYEKRYKEETESLRREREMNMKRLAAEIKSLSEQEADALKGSIEQAFLIRQRNQYEYRLKKLRESKNEETDRKLAELRAKQKNSQTKRIEGRMITQAKARIRKNVETLNSMLAHGTENRHVPINMVRSTIEMLEAIDINTGNSKSLAKYLEKMENIYTGLKDAEAYAFDYDERTRQNIDNLKKLFADRNYTQLSLDELNQVVDITKALIQQIQNANKLMLKKKKADAVEFSREAIREVREAKHIDNAFMNGLDHYLTPHLNAFREFRKLSGYKDGRLMELYKDLDEGQLKQISVMRDINELFDDVLKNTKEVKNFTSTDKKDLVDSGLKDEKGNPVMITKAQRMSIIMHSYNDRNMEHIIYGGIRVPDLTKKDRKEALARAKIYFYVPPTDIRAAILGDDVERLDLITERATMKVKELEKQLSPWEKEFLAKVKEMFWHKTGGYINETSLKLKGYALARVGKYFPIPTDQNFIKKDIGNLVQDGTLEGKGFLKERKFGRNAIILEDITDTILRQTNDVAKYTGLAIPLRNLNMAWNTTVFTNAVADTLSNAVSNAWGKNNVDFISNLVVDLTSRRDGGDATFLDAMRGRFAGAVLTLNPSVSIKQAASYFTAGAIVGNRVLAKTAKDIGKGFFKKQGIAELEKINPLLWYRNQGNATQELADMKRTGFGKNLPIKVQKALNWVEFMDTGTIRTLEYAAKNYVDANFNLSGAEYWNKVSEVFTQIVEQTQPNYTPLQQADIIRNPNKALKLLVMFKTQPLQNMGVIYDAIGELKTRVKEGADTKEAKQKLIRAITSQVQSAMTFSMMTILANLLLHKFYKYKDDDDKFSWEKVLEEFGAGITKSFWGMLLFGQELVDALQSLLNGEKMNGLNVSFLDNIANLGNACMNLQKQTQKRLDAKTEADRQKYNNGIIIYGGKVADYIGQIGGVPVGNLKNMIESLILYGLDVSEGKIGVSEISTKVDSQYDRMYDALVANDRERYMKLFNEMVEAKTSDGKTQAEAEKSVNDSVKSYIKEGYVAGELTYEQAYTILTKDIGMSETDAYYKLDEWLYKSEENDSYTKYSRMTDAINEVIGGKVDRTDIKTTITDLMENGVSAETVRGQITKTYKTQYLELKSKNQASTLKSILLTAYMATGMTEDDANKKIDAWK